MAEAIDNDIIAKVVAAFPEGVTGHRVFAGEPYISLDRSVLRDVCRLLKDDASMEFDYPAEVTAVDYLGETPRFEVIHVLWSMRHRRRVILKTRLTEEDPEIDTVSDIWRGANFMERETFDLYGIRFAGHPDLRRIMMTDDFEGHPLRKDYPIEGDGWRENYDFVPMIGD